MSDTVNSSELLAAGQSSIRPPSGAGELVARMAAADRPLVSLAGHDGMRRFCLENLRFHKSVRMILRVPYQLTGTKTFEVFADGGSKAIHHRTFWSMLAARSDGSRNDQRSSTRIRPANHSFRVIGTNTSRGAMSYALPIPPKTKNKFLIEGSPAKNLLFWTRSIHYERRYERAGAFWLPMSDLSTADVLGLGQTVVTINSFDCIVKEHRLAVAVAQRAEGDGVSNCHALQSKRGSA